MSWIFGVIPKNKYGYVDLTSPDCDDLIFKYTSKKINLFAGSKAKNLYSNIDTDSKGWVVSGIGIQNEDNSTKILANSDWEKILGKNNKSDILRELDGHFVVVEWNENSVAFYSDVLGLRDIYIAENEDNIYFSTNVKWLAKYIDLEINFFEFGSRWLLYNQISDKSIFKNVKRLVAGQNAVIALNENFTINYQDYNWLPEIRNTKFGINEFSSKLSSLINLNLPAEHNLSLSLSGGMDSRVILSFLLNKSDSIFDAHTFGNTEFFDTVIADRIAEKFSFKHEHFNAGLPAADKVIQQISDYTTQTLVNNSASAFLQLQNYFYLKDRKGIVIDGGFGEIWRSEFFYKLYLRGKKALQAHDIQNIIPYLKVQRADIFNDDIIEEMNTGVQLQLEELFKILPNINKIGIRNWLDIFAIKTRLTNYYSPEQTWLDRSITSMMPFIQPSILNEILNMPVNLRQNSKLFRNLIKLNAPSLKKFGLAKGKFIHPFFLNSLQSRVWSFIQTKFERERYIVDSTEELLSSLKEFVFDTINSQKVKECSIYDYKKINYIIESYYKGNLYYKSELDWWLSFELLRQSI